MHLLKNVRNNPHDLVGLVLRAMDGYALGGMLGRCRTAACGQKNRVRLHVCWRTAASEHGRSYAISRTLTWTWWWCKASFEKDVTGNLFMVVHLVCLVYLVEL